MYTIRTFIFKIFEHDSISKYALKVKNGDNEAFNYIDEETRAQLKRIIFKYENNYHDRQDLEQTLMERGYLLCFKYNPNVGSFKNYLFRTWKLELKNYYRLKKKSLTTNYIHEAKSITMVCNEEAGLYYSPLDVVLIDEHKRLYCEDKTKYSKLESVVLEYLMYGLTIKEISQMLSLDRKVIYNSIYRIKQKQFAFLKESS